MTYSTDPMIEVGRGKYVRKSSIERIFLSEISPDVSFIHSDEPCVTIFLSNGSEVEKFHCHSKDKTIVEQHMKWLLSHFETASIPPGSPFGQPVQPEEPL